MDKKKGYRLDRPESIKAREAYLDNQFIYDNRTYVSNGAILGIKFSSTKKGPFDDEPHYDQIQSRGKDVYTNNNFKTRSQKKRCLWIAMIIIVILVVAIVATVLAVTLSSESDEKEVEMVEGTAERIIMGDVTLKSKNWTDAYNNKNSMEYKTTTKEVFEMMDTHLRNSEFSDVYSKISIESLRAGSVIAEYYLTLRKTRTFVKNEDSAPPSFDFNVDTDLLLKTLRQIPEVADVSASDVTKCLPNVCRNGAICESNLSSYVCTCQPGYTGNDCSEGVTTVVASTQEPTTTEDRLNTTTLGVTTVVGSTTGTFTTEERLTTTTRGVTTVASTQEATTKYDRLTTTTRGNWTCRKFFDQPELFFEPKKRECTAHYECDSRPCYNGGTCFDFINGYYCLCSPEWLGAQCDKSYTETTTVSTGKPYTGPTTTTTTSGVKTTTKSPCGTGVRYDYELRGAILWPFFEDLNFSDSPGYKTMENTVIETLKNATKEYGLSICNQNLKRFYPYKSSSTASDPGNTETYIGFTVVISMLSPVYEVEVQIIFALLPDHLEFISFQALLSTTMIPTTTLTTYPPDTCSSSTPKMIYSFKITYVQKFTTDLYNSTSDSFKKLNQTLAEAFMKQARINNGDQWICSIGLIRCLPVLSNLNTDSGSGSEDLHVSTVIRVHVPVNTLDIHTAAYYFSEAALESGKIFLNTYDIFFAPSTTKTTSAFDIMTTETTLAPQTTTTTASCLLRCDLDSKCLQLDQYCDGRDDCIDGSDEQSCPTL